MNTNNISPEVFSLYSKFLSENVGMSGADKNLLGQILNIVERSSIKLLQEDENTRSELFKLYKALAKSSQKGIQETDPRKIIFKDIDLTSKNFLDYGSNKFDTIMKLNNWGAGANFYACDVVEKTIVDERLIGKIDYRVIKEDSILPYEDEFFDVINVQYVLHHIASDESLKILLNEFKRIIKPTGQIILWEETFYNASKNDLPGLTEFNNSIGIATDLKLSQEFYNLHDDKKFEFILLNDVMINLNNPHMQWDVNYKRIETLGETKGWKDVFASEGINFKYLYNFALRSSGSIKQGVNMVLYFEKSV